MIVTLLASYFLSQNIYNYIMYAPLQVDANDLPEVDDWANFWALWDRFQGYVVVTVVAFVAFYFLRESNDKVEIEKLMKLQEKEKEAKEKADKIQAERELKIIRAL